jgi:2-succinyl-5-enolpyruvyl-6-hydroxy-3-cyclohexene-1-carboxylate synthase
LQQAEPGSAPAAIVERLAAGGRGLIVAGGGAGDPQAVQRMAEALGWPVLADPRSGCRIPSALTVGAADALLRCSSVAGWRPEVVLRLGRPWASKVVNGWLAGLGPDADQVLVDPFGAWPDPDRLATVVVAADATGLCLAVTAAAGAGSGPSLAGGGLGGGGFAPHGWARRWALAEAAAQAAIDQVLAAHSELTEPGVARALTAILPDQARLFCSSSMPVRDVEWYARPRYGCQVFSNRGANGIDGVVSTAIGVVLADPERPTVVLMGDLAFLYDAAALLGAARRNISLTLVVVDNNGGGIFSFLPQAAAVAGETFEQFWGTPHGLDLAEVATAYGVAVEQVAGADDLAPAVGRCLGAGGVRMVLVRTERRANVAIHDEIHAAVAGAVANL